MTQAIIIGSGIGGLAAAIRLARQGITVDVYESAKKAGGKVSQLHFDGFRFDAGPSLLTLPELVHELLDEDLRFPIRKLDVITKYFYPDGTQVSAYSNVERFSDEVGQKLQVPDFRSFHFRIFSLHQKPDELQIAENTTEFQKTSGIQ